MAKSQQTFSKKEKEKNRLKKREDKLKRKVERKANAGSSDFDSMIAYIDENGNITDTPLDPARKSKIKAENIEIGIPRRENEEIDPVHKGFVEFFNDQKGFGFIKDAVSGEKFFVHVHGLIDEIVEGNKVSFELEKGMKGMNAVKVTKIK